MDEAYKILKKEQHPHWDRFKVVHSEKIVNYVRTLLGEKVDKERFIEVYARLTSAPERRFQANGRKRLKWKIKTAKHAYDFLLNKAKWIK